MASLKAVRHPIRVETRRSPAGLGPSVRSVLVYGGVVNWETASRKVEKDDTYVDAAISLAPLPAHEKAPCVVICQVGGGLDQDCIRLFVTAQMGQQVSLCHVAEEVSPAIDTRPFMANHFALTVTLAVG